MKDIRDTFHSEGMSLFDTLSNNDVIGYTVPLYQRRYSWDKTHIERVLKDVQEGMYSVKHDENIITFLGALIFVEIEVDAFRSRASSIVDGQQRLTTLILICVKLHTLLTRIKNDLDTENNSVLELLDSKIEERLDELFACFSKNKAAIPKKSSDYYPILIREHSDYWHKNPSKCEYVSPVSDYLHKYIEFVYSAEDRDFSWNSKKTGEDVKYFLRNEELIGKWLEDFIKSQLEDDLLQKIISTKLSKHLLRLEEDEKKLISKEYNNIINHDDSAKAAILVLCYSEYLLRRIAITNVRVADEAYGFDIFEALNTTGAPLTAIETFRPVVARYEDRFNENKGGYERSNSKLMFDDVDTFLDQFDKSSQKTKESSQIVLIFANIIKGEKVPLKLDFQRSRLKQWYEDIPVESRTIREKYVSYLSNICSFKNDFWDKKRIANQLNDWNEHKEEILFHLEFLRDTNTTMVIPIILRYLNQLREDHNIQNFKKACIYTSSFVAVWRAYTCGTGAIDSALLKVMSGGVIKSTQYKCLRLGDTLDNKILSPEELRKTFVALLHNKRITTKEEWIKVASTQPLYNGSKALCKYLLLLAHHKAILNDKNLVKNSRRPSYKNDLVNYRSYVDPIHSTVEHVAPQNFAKEWDEMFDRDATTVHTIGNLALLPVKENSSAGNKSWDKKVLLFRAFGAETSEELSDAISIAQKAGHQLKNDVIKLLEGGSTLEMAKYLTKSDKWDNETVSKRSKNLLECAWQELNSALQIEEKQATMALFD